MITENASPLALAMAGCRRCEGLGEITKRNRHRVCACVYRRVFRACGDRYHELRQHDGDFARRVTMERTSHRGRRSLSAGFKAAEYLADFELVSRRALRDMPLESEVFRYHCLQRLPWPACFPLISRSLGQPLTRGNFFHAVYRLEETLGQAFLKLRPYGLLPREYFSGCYVQLGSPPAGEIRGAPEERDLAAHAA